jgi:hypothetical protein
MDIHTQPREIQVKWLSQRGWEPHPELLNVFIDPDTRETRYLSQALVKALADCRLASDFELKVEPPAPKRVL